MRTDIRESLTGQTVRIAKGTPIVLTGWCFGEDADVEVVSTWFAINGTVEAIEVIHPHSGNRVQVWQGFTPIALAAA